MSGVKSTKYRRLDVLIDEIPAGTNRC